MQWTEKTGRDKQIQFTNMAQVTLISLPLETMA